MGQQATKEKIAWSRINTSEQLLMIPKFLDEQDVNNRSKVRPDKNGHPFVLLGFTGKDGFEGNRAAIWFEHEGLSMKGLDIIDEYLGGWEQ